MQNKNNEGAQGRLPAIAPLANPYVPFQEENSPQYEARRGLVRGTIFPGLDLPFLGMVNKNELAVTKMTELQALGFAVQELALYLDTHRDDMEAMEIYRNYQKLYQKYAEEYESKNGPLTHKTVSTAEKYDWLKEPWPWEYCMNKEE